MKFKTFILTFLMMMSCSISFGQGSLTGSATTEAQLWMHLNDDEIGTISLANDIKITATCPIPNGKKVTIDLNGHKLFTEEEIYIINNEGKLTITDNSEGKTGTISSTLGIYNGVTPTRTSVTDVKYDRVLTINGGVFNSSSKNGNAATIYNYRGVIKINGGEFYGEHSAITNYGMATIANAYIECLNRDNGAAAIINDYEITYGENVNIVGIYTTVTGTAYTTGTKPTYLFAELKNGPKYPSLQAALDACTTGDNTINLLFHNSDNATVSQKEGVNITIDGNGYKGKQFEYTGTIYVNGNSRHTGAETLTIQDVNFVTTDNEHDFISCNDGGDPVIRYAHNVTVQDCNFTATEGSTAVVALRFRQSYNINVVNSEFTNLHSAMWATGTSGIAFDNIEVTNCKEGGISVGTSTTVSVKNSTIAGAQYGVRADGSGAYSLTVENSKLTAEVPVIVRNTTGEYGEYNLTVKEDAILTAADGKPQVVVTADSDNKPYVVPTSNVNVTLYDNVTSTFGLTAKIGNAFYATLQDAVDNAKDDDEIVLVSDVTEDVTITQKADLDLIIAGAGKKFTGVMTVFGDARHDGNETLTIKDIDFVAKNGSDACILSPDRTAQNPARYSYSHNVTVYNCTFTDPDGNVNCAAIRHNDGGDVDWTLNKCTVDNTMHSLIQTNNVKDQLVIAECTVNSKNGVNLNSCTNVEMTGCNFDVKGYAVRVGVNGGTSGAITLNNNTLKSACEDGDAVIIVRGSAVTQVDLSMTENVVSGTTHISGNTADTKIAADENYWDGKEAPVVAEGSAPIVVNSYYSDDALTNLVRNEMGSIYAFVSSDRIFGDVTTNAKESIKIEIIGKDGNLIGTLSLENLSYATGFNKQLTWRINLGDDDSDSWAMAWEEGCPSINNMPAKVKLYVDAKEGDAAVAEAEIKYTANGDGQSPVFAAKTNAEGRINSFIACTGEYNLNNAANKLVSASADGDNIAILVAGTYAVPTGKNLTITGAVDGVQFGPILEPNMGMKNYTFNNVTFNYAANSHYKGLQYAGDMVYNNCTFNGQVFLYGNKETFNNCTFNQEDSNIYNVWTYSAKEVAFNECTFNSAGKSVLIYHEGATTFNDVAVTKCEFNASQTVDGKAAIEMDSHLTAGINLTIDAATTATGFGSGNVSHNSLWNNKMGNNNDANNDITVVVAGETVLKPVYEAQIGDTKFRNLEDAFAAVTDNTTLIIFEGEYDNALSINKSNVTVTGDGEVKLKGVPSLKGTNYKVENIDFVYSTGSTNLSGSGLIKDCSFTATAGDGDNFRYCYGTEGAKITFENCVLDAPMWAIHFDSAPGLDLVLTDCKINGRVALGANLGSLAATGTTFENGYVNVWGTEDGATFTESKFVDVPYIFTGYDADNIVEFNDCEVTVGNDTSDVVSIIYGGIGNADALIYVDDVLMTGVAAVNNIHYATFEEALEAIDDNVTLKLLKDIDIEDPITITKNNVTLDGNEKTLTYTGLNRAIDITYNPEATINTTIKNLEIVAETANRGINYNDNGTLNVDNVTVTIGDEVDGYAINFPGLADGATVNITNSTLTSRNPLNIWGENMTINVTDSEITSVDGNDRYNYAAIQLNNEIPTVGPDGAIANGTVVTVTGGKITALDETGEPSFAVANATETGVVNISETTVVVGKQVNYVLNIGGAYFATLQQAIDAIENDGYNSPIVVMKNFSTDEMATVKNDLNVTIDLNGKTITGTDNTTKNFSIIDNRGTLTIIDDTESKEGKITLTATIDSDWNRYSAVIANNPGGKLTIEAGTIEHLGGTDMAYGIDNLTNGKGTYAETVINGGTIKSTYRAIRQFLNGTEARNILTVNGGTIEGANKSIWMQDPNTYANSGALTVTEDAKLFGDVNLTATAGSTEWPVEVSIAAVALQGESTVLTSNLPLGIDVQNINGTYGVVNVVAQIDGTTYYQTFEAALNAVQDGQTITVLNVEGSENKELEFTKGITFTITGEAPNYALPVVTFQNATVNISNAKILIPELDARQNATINVINSTVYDAGGDGIVKSYYNGAINIDANSTVYTMQVTTMGYITVDGTLNATWQTNVYGNGLITLNNGATFATAGLNLIAKYYDGRDNTDADRVGKPAEIVVNGANFTVGKVYSASGADYSYNADGYGINVGTIEGKSAILTIKNGGNVNIYTGDGKTANIGADGTVNIDASTFNVECRAENGTATLANNGTMNVTGEANLAAANVTGNGWFYMNGVTLDDDTKLLGAKVRFASGTNNIDGSTINDGFFQVGIGAYKGVDANVDTEDGVVVNVKNAVVGANGDTYAGWAGTGFYDTDAEKAAAMTNAKYVLNIENSIAEFGYLHISNDGELNVNGNATEKAWYNNSDYSFYAGEVIINGTATFDATDVLALYTKVSCDNGTDNPGTLNINEGTEYEAERHNGAVAGLNFDIRKTGVANVAEGANLHVGEPASIAADATMNIGGTATVLGELTNNGTINFTSETATLTVPTTGLTVNNATGNNDIKVVYENGTYKFIDKHYVAEIVGGAKYESLAEAATAAQDGETIQLLWNEGDAAISMAATFVGNKTVTIKGTANVDWSKGWFYVGRGGEGDGHVIFDNAILTSVSDSRDHGIHVSGREKNTNNKYDGTVVINNSTIVLDYLINKGTMTLDNSTLTVKNGFAVGGRPASETESGEDATATMTLNNGSKVVVYNHNGMGLGYEAIGIMNIDATSTFETTQSFLVTANGTMNVNGGNVKVAGTLTNNGTMVVAAESNVEVTGNLNVNGTLNSAGNITGAIVKAPTATIQLTGGIYTTEPQDGWCAENYGAFPYDENSWVVREISGTQTFELTAGWNWVSSYITEFDKDGLTWLKEDLSKQVGAQIKNNLHAVTNYEQGWFGSLTNVSVKEMYKVKTTADTTFTHEGSYVNYDECEIVLYPGWNYISYPVNEEMNLIDALAKLQPSSNDIIKRQDATATYAFGAWRSAFTLTPGQGYMYKNASDEIKSFYYTTKKTTSTDSNNRSSKYWTVEATQYPSNMTMIAMTDVEGGDYEVAAFVNGELRGSSRPVYVEELNAHILILTISGDEVAEVTFKYYDIATGEEVAFSNRINYSNDAVVGSMAEPYMLTRGTTGIGEASLSEINIYPNPTTTGTEINLQATCDKVEVFNALGVKVAEYQNVDTIDALETAGIYVIRITNNGNVQNCRLVVK